MSINNLEEVGEVMHLAKSNRIIVRILRSKNKEIRPGEVLVDEKNKVVGKVVEMIGPVVSPYASLFPLSERTNKILGCKLYQRRITSNRRRSHR